MKNMTEKGIFETEAIHFWYLRCECNRFTVMIYGTVLKKIKDLKVENNCQYR